MKNLILSAVLIFSLVNTISASSDPVESLKVISSAKVEFTLSSVDQLSLFEEAIYLPIKNVIKFETKSEMKFIQVFDDTGVLVYQLPVSSSKVRISKSLFTKGNYRLGFVFKNEKDVHFTSLTVN